MWLLIGCSDRPDYVLSERKMTDLLVDIYKGEGLIEIERVKYSPDSVKKALRQSIYLAHGVTDSQVDSSYQWYGKHLTEFIEIHDEVIKRLEDDIADVSDRPVIFAEGDSVNIWNREARFRSVDSDLASLISFEIEADENSEKGDNFQLLLKMLSPTSQLSEIDGVICVEYDDGLIELRSIRLLDRNGWCKLRLVTDTARVYTRIFGHISAVAQPEEVIFVDSLSLVRTRFRNDTWQQRNGQRKFRQKARKVTSL